MVTATQILHPATYTPADPPTVWRTTSVAITEDASQRMTTIEHPDDETVPAPADPADEYYRHTYLVPDERANRDAIGRRLDDLLATIETGYVTYDGFTTDTQRQQFIVNQFDRVLEALFLLTRTVRNEVESTGPS